MKEMQNQNRQKSVNKSIKNKSLQSHQPKRKDWIKLVGRAAEIFAYVVIQLFFAVLLIYEIVGYIIFKIR